MVKRPPFQRVLGTGGARRRRSSIKARCSLIENEFERAAECLRHRYSRRSRPLGDARGTAIALVAVSKLQERRGEYQDALNGLHAALERLQRIGDLVWEGACLSAIGSVYLRIGEAVNALDYWERALASASGRRG